MPGQALAKHDLAPLIHPYRVKHPLRDVNPEYAHLLFHGTRLLWRHGFIGLRNHCGSSKSIRTGAGPFYYDRMIVADRSASVSTQIRSPALVVYADRMRNPCSTDTSFS